MNLDNISDNDLDNISIMNSLSAVYDADEAAASKHWRTLILDCGSTIRAEIAGKTTYPFTNTCGWNCAHAALVMLSRAMDLSALTLRNLCCVSREISSNECISDDDWDIIAKHTNVRIVIWDLFNTREHGDGDDYIMLAQYGGHYRVMLARYGKRNYDDIFTWVNDVNVARSFAFDLRVQNIGPPNEHIDNLANQWHDESGIIDPIVGIPVDTSSDAALAKILQEELLQENGIRVNYDIGNILELERLRIIENLSDDERKANAVLPH
jgi:hypothetical protein